jgi:hypothetical protein
MPDDRAPARTFSEWRAGRSLPRWAALLFGLFLPAVVLTLHLLRASPFTVDDSYISFRYARNLARGLGLVYNPGERVEGYTNFLWTVVLAGGIRLGLDPVVLSKALGAGAAYAALGLTYALSDRLQPFRSAPCLATWLLVTTVTFTGYAVFGLETIAFVALVLWGTWWFVREREEGGVPWSGLVFAAAGLTRPEAPLFLGILMLSLGRGIVGRANLLRAALFAAPVGAHLLFRRLYYGTLLPNTLGAKTGNLAGQLHAGWLYLQGYAAQAGVALFLAVLGLVVAPKGRRRDLLAIAAIAAAVVGYVVLVGGDWMKYHRFLAPAEPFVFLLACVGARDLLDRRRRAVNACLLAFGLLAAVQRGSSQRAAEIDLLRVEKRFWDQAAGGTAAWMNEHAGPGELALGDIGYVGWATDRPILDLLGLVDPEIARLPGGYTQKLGPGLTARFFQKRPRYALIISAGNDCRHPSVPGARVLFGDRRFGEAYSLAGRVRLDPPFSWCIYERNGP